MMLFKVSPNENFSVTLLLQACLKVNAKVVVHDLQKAQHYITAEPQSQEDTDELLSLIESFYTIDSIDIDTTEIKNKEERTLFNFQDEKLNQQFTILADAVAECLNKGLVPNGYILSAIQGLHAKLKLTMPITGFEVADIVDCNYGTNMPYETSGGHIWNLVVAKNEHQAFVIPMFKNTAESQDQNNDAAICFAIDEKMATFDSIKTDLSSTFLALNAGRWISNYRISKKIGKCTDDCLKKVIIELQKAFDFTYNLKKKKSVEQLERACALK